MRASQLLIETRGCRTLQSLSLLAFNAQAALREALGASEMGVRSATAYSQLVAAEAEKEAAVKRRDYYGRSRRGTSATCCARSSPARSNLD